MREFLFGHVSCESAASHRHKDVQVEAVVGLLEEEDEAQAEEAGAGQTPVQPGQLWKRRHKIIPGGRKRSGDAASPVCVQLLVRKQLWRRRASQVDGLTWRNSRRSF